MPKFKLRVSDTITLLRYHDIEVEAETIGAAEENAIEMAANGDFHDVWSEEQIDNTPYTAEEVEDWNGDNPDAAYDDQGNLRAG